jgi:hypothetical protein
MHRQGSIAKFALLFSIVFLFVAQPSWAGRVVKVKGKKVYIILDQEEVGATAKGDNLYTTTRSGQKRGIVTVRAKKGNKVIAQLRKGKAAKRMLTKPRKGRKKKRRQAPMMMEEASEVAITEADERTEFPEMMFGLIGTYGQATQTVTNVAELSGSLLGVKAVFDYELFSGLGVQARLGMDMLSVTGTNNNVDYTTDLNYLTLDFFLRYYLMRSDSFGLFGNLGMGIYSPMSTELGPEGNPALQEDSISTTSVGIIGLGIAIPLGGMEFQLGADYYIFPPSDTVDTSVFGAKFGVLFAL